VPKGKQLELVLRGRIQSNEAFVELARVSVIGITPQQLNTKDPEVIKLRANPVPRLSVGLQRLSLRWIKEARSQHA
jgi:hypothetical protein